MQSLIVVLCACVLAVNAHGATSGSNLMGLLGGGQGGQGGQQQQNGGNMGNMPMRGGGGMEGLLSALLANLLTNNMGNGGWRPQVQQQQQQPSIMDLLIMQQMTGHRGQGGDSGSEDKDLSPEQKAVLEMHMYSQLYEGMRMYMHYKDAEKNFMELMTGMCIMLEVSKQYGAANNLTWNFTTDEGMEALAKAAEGKSDEEKFKMMMDIIKENPDRFYEILIRVANYVCESGKAYHEISEKIMEKVEGRGS